MPDYTYHPFLKPILFRLPVEFSRRLTLRLLEIQSRTALGRSIFKLFGHGLPPATLRRTVFGLDFPGPIGLGPNIDNEGTTIPVMQHLGFGFITIGPAANAPTPRTHDSDPLRDVDSCSLIFSGTPASPGAGELANRIQRAPDLHIPIGIALTGADIAHAITAARHSAAFFTIPPWIVDNPDALSTLRSTTSKPLLLRIDSDWSSEQLFNALDVAIRAGFSGCVATTGSASPKRTAGERDHLELFDRSLAVVALIAQRHGAAFPVIASGGIFTPEQALQMLDAGAHLVELRAGLVFAGPGLPGRIVHALEHRLKNPSEICPPALGEPILPKRELTWNEMLGPALVALTGVALILAGLFALILAATIKLLPHDVAYLGMTMQDLCDRDQCRIVHFMTHDRVSFGGSIISIGLVYAWLAWVPLRNGEAWSWWTLLLSGIVGFSSFLTYIGYGYLDTVHAVATLALLVVFVLGMLLSFQKLRGTRHVRSLKSPGAPAWFWSSAGLGRAYLLFTAFGMILGGFTIMLVGMTVVFVPQDLEYMQVTIPEIRAINERLVPLIAHDRAGFGGGLCSGGIAIYFAAWKGLRPGARTLWWICLVAGTVGFATSIGIHPLVGYNSLLHLLPAYIGALTFALSMKYLYRPIFKPLHAEHFPPL